MQSAIRTAPLRHLGLVIMLITCALLVLGCSSRQINDFVDNGPGEFTQTDEMFERDENDAELTVFQLDDTTYMVKTCDRLDSVGLPLEDGHFYQLVADVTYLNGGVAGYVDYPQIKDVVGCTEISPEDLHLPSITETVYGLVAIGDYADGDILLNSMGHGAVWKDGSWVYRYDDSKELSDGTSVLVRDGVEEDDIRAGIQNGVLSCEDYFVLPNA